MTQCTLKLPFKFIKKRKVIANFTGGNITSDAGLLLLREIDNRSSVIDRFASQISDCREQNK